MANEIPPPPPGFTLDTPQASGGIPPPPPGFTLDAAPAPPKTAAAPEKGAFESLAQRVRLTEEYDPQATQGEMAQGAVAPGVARAAAGGALGAMAAATGDSEKQIRERNQQLGLTSGNEFTDQMAGFAGSLLAPLPSGEIRAPAAGVAKATTPVSKVTGAMGARSPEAAARAYTQKLGLDWSKLSDSFKSTLTDIAQDSTRLEKLDAEAVKRKARLDTLGLPATRGQATRDLSQLTREEAITKSDAGLPIRNINAEQDRILHQHLDTLRGQTGGSAATQQQVGKSVQGSLRAKLRDVKSQASKAYDLANTLGEKELTKTDTLEKFLQHPINDANVGWVRSRLEKLKNPDGTISLKSLEDIRQELTAAAKTPDKGGHYASEAAKVIDKIMDEAGSSAYKNARQGWKAMKDEFDKQGRIKKLVSEKGMSADRATALEDTFDTVVRKGSAEDLEKVKTSLTTGGNAKIVKQGQQGWRDLQAATIDYLKQAASGKRSIPGEKGQLQFNSTFIDAVHELDADGKLEVVFDKGVAGKLRALAEATRDVRTKPTGRIAGSDTAPRILNFLENLAHVPIIGKYAAGVGKGVKKIGEMGEETRQVSRATTSPLEDEAKAATSGVLKRDRRATLQDLTRIVPAGAGATLRQLDQGNDQ